LSHKEPDVSFKNEMILVEVPLLCELVDDGTLSLRKIVGAINLTVMFSEVVTKDKLRSCTTSLGSITSQSRSYC
jgi:hypothetical protein